MIPFLLCFARHCCDTPACSAPSPWEGTHVTSIAQTPPGECHIHCSVEGTTNSCSKKAAQRKEGSRNPYKYPNAASAHAHWAGIQSNCFGVIRVLIKHLSMGEEHQHPSYDVNETVKETTSSSNLIPRLLWLKSKNTNLYYSKRPK